MIPSVLLEQPGAVAGQGIDSAVAAHYGHPADEQLALAAGVGLTDLSHLDVVTVSGPDRLTWLTTLSTQILTDLREGDSKRALLLDAQGRIRWMLAVADTAEETTYLITEAGTGADLVEFLNSMRFMLRVEVDLATEQWGVLGTRVPRDLVAGCEENALKPHQKINFGDLPKLIWFDPWPLQDSNGASYCAKDLLDAPNHAAGAHPGEKYQRLLFVVPRQKLETAVVEILRTLQPAEPVELAGGWFVDQSRLAGLDAWEVMRVADWLPRQSREVDSRALPHELDLLRCDVHLNKGCYCGQETVARIINLGKPPRRLVLLNLDGSTADIPRSGDRVFIGARPVGQVTTVVCDAQRGPQALALLRRAVTTGEVEVEVSEETDPASAADLPRITAKVIDIVRPDGRSDHTPQVRPGQGLRVARLKEDGNGTA